MAWGDFRQGIKIFDGSDTFYVAAGMNRKGSNAQSLAIGMLKRTRCLFLAEFYSTQTTYTDNPEITSREIIDTSALNLEPSIWNKKVLFFNGSLDINHYQVFSNLLNENYDNNVKRLIKRYPNTIKIIERTIETISR